MNHLKAEADIRYKVYDWPFIEELETALTSFNVQQQAH